MCQLSWRLPKCFLCKSNSGLGNYFILVYTKQPTPPLPNSVRSKSYRAGLSHWSTNKSVELYRNFCSRRNGQKATTSNSLRLMLRSSTRCMARKSSTCSQIRRILPALSWCTLYSSIRPSRNKVVQVCFKSWYSESPLSGHPAWESEQVTYW